LASYYRRLYTWRRRRSFVPGFFKFAASGAITLASVTAAGTGVMKPAGSGAVTLASVTADATGVMKPSGAGAITLSPVTASGTGNMKPSGAGDVTLSPVTASGTGNMKPTGAGAITLASVTVSGSGQPRISGSGSINLAPVTVQGFGRQAEADRGIRVEVWNVAGTAKLGRGPLTSVSGIRYRYYLDEIGSGSVVLSASDPQFSLLTGRVQIRIYVAGEGLVFRGPLLRWHREPYGQATLELASLEEELIGLNTGLGFTIDDETPSGAVAQIVMGTTWTAQIVGSTSIPYSKRIDARSLWQALVDHANAVGGHMRADAITLSAGTPVKLTQTVAADSDNGLIFKLVERLTPELADNATVIPLAEFSEEQDAGELYNRVVVMGAGDGYPMMTLKNSEHGYNFATDPTFLTSVDAGLNNSAIIRCTRANSGGYLELTWASGTDFYTQLYKTDVSGATSGRSFGFGVLVHGNAGAVGKTAYLTSFENGGAFGAQYNPTTVTVVLTAADQFVPLSHDFIRNDRTLIGVEVGLQAAASGNKLYVTDVDFWEDTTFPYPVRFTTGPGGTTEYYIHDRTSIASYGSRTKYLNVKDAVPTVVGIDAYYAASNLRYDVGRRYLDLHKAAVSRYTVRPV
jgi:hypothetical protein